MKGARRGCENLTPRTCPEGCEIEIKTERRFISSEPSCSRAITSLRILDTQSHCFSQNSYYSCVHSSKNNVIAL